MKDTDWIVIEMDDEEIESTWKDFVDANRDGWFSDHPEDIQKVEEVLDSNGIFAIPAWAAMYGLSALLTIHIASTRKRREHDVIQRDE